MKKNDWAILLSTIAYSILFYHQNAGINFLLFTILLIGILAIMNPALLKTKQWLFTASLSLFSGLFVLLYGSTLALWANCVSLLLLSAVSFNSKSSVIFNLFYSIYSIGGSIVFMIINTVNSSIHNTENSKKKNYLQILTYLIPIVLVLIFFFIYKSANPLFEKFTEKINLDFISGEWILFTLGGFLLIYGFIRHQRIKAIDEWENNLPTSLSNSNLNPSKWNEKNAATLLFVLLNVMLIFINLLDVNYLYLGSGLPEGVSHKTFVHNGVGMLILSILLAISIIMYFFRGELNFNEKSKTVKFLVYLWIIQNIMMIVSTMIRNNMYVGEYLLTYKRIGVYCWLFMAALGLITTFIKIWKIKTNWYLFKSNSLTAYIILVIAAGCDWDKFISDYNISHTKGIAQLDKKYLISLSETNLAQLYNIKDSSNFNTDSVFHYSANRGGIYYEASYSAGNTSDLDQKLYNYLKHIEGDDWRSFSMRKKRIIHDLIELNKEGKISSLDYSTKYLQTLQPVYLISNVKEINFNNCSLKSLKELEHFEKLENINLSNNHLTSLDSLPELNALTNLNLNTNSISDLKNLKQLPAIQQLDLSNNRLSNIFSMPRLERLTTLTLDDNQISDYNPLARVPKLEWLSISNSSVGIERFPQLSKLKQLNMNYCTQGIARSLHNMKILPNLEYLSLQSNGLKNTDVLVSYNSLTKEFSSKFSSITYLDLSNNELYQLTGLNAFSNLKTLDLGSNQLKNLDAITSLAMLKKLYLNNNAIDNLNFLNILTELQELSLNQDTYINNFEPIKKLEKLTYLNLSGTSFNTLNLITCSESLVNLNLSNCLITSYKGIEAFKKLETLSVSNLKATDLVYLKQLKQLKTLSISQTDKELAEQLKKALPKTKVEIAENIYGVR